MVGVVIIQKRQYYRNLNLLVGGVFVRRRVCGGPYLGGPTLPPSRQTNVGSLLLVPCSQPYPTTADVVQSKDSPTYSRKVKSIYRVLRETGTVTCPSVCPIKVLLQLVYW